MAQIHPTALVDSKAELAADVVVGAFCIVEAGAVIGPGCRLEPRSTIKGRTTLGANNEVGESTILGGFAQHAHQQIPGGTLVVGDNNRFRENITVHRGWNNDAVTTIGNNNLLMVGSHVGHDCRVGSNCIIVNHVLLGGHVQVEDRAYLGGGAAVHQFCRIGKYAMIGGLQKITQDVPPYVMVDHCQVIGLNKVGLRRAGFTPADMQQLKEAYRIIYREGRRWSEVLELLAAEFPAGHAAAFHEFFKTGKRGFVQERRISRMATLKIVDPAQDEEEAADKRKRGAA